MVLFPRNELFNLALLLCLALFFLFRAEAGRSQRDLAQIAAPATPAVPATPYDPTTDPNSQDYDPNAAADAADAASAAAAAAGAAAGGVYDVTKFGAKGDGVEVKNADGDPENGFSFMRAWKAACEAPTGKVLVPPGKFVTGQMFFSGPCKNPRPVVEVHGTVMASTDVTVFKTPEWVAFENVNGVILTGNGTFDGQGQERWKANDCRTLADNCIPPPTSIYFHRANNSVIEGIKSVNSKFFHIFITISHNVTVRNVHLTAPPDSPNTDGIHTSGSDLVTVTNSVIGSGDDCVSVGQGSVNVTVSGIQCGPGHGISIGSLGKQEDEKPVKFIHVKNCTFTKTTNGARIKTWAGKKVATQASDIIFEDLLFDQVKNPIIIDQHYGSKDGNGQSSEVKISNVQFKNIKGSASTNQVVNFACSKEVPCEGIQVNDIDIKPTPEKGVAQVASACVNAKVVFGGKHDGLSCDGAPAAAAANNKPPPK
ncbi:hypothetical protein Ancab_021846 [Ancistrocladus abbreviatus]